MQSSTNKPGRNRSEEQIPEAEERFEIYAVAIPTQKRSGEAAEAAFLAKASSLGFGVAKPWGDSERYDFILDSGHGFHRVQVKSTALRVKSRYHVKTSSSAGYYTCDEIDFLVAYIVPEDLWYVLPVGAFAPKSCLNFSPHFLSPSGRRSLYEKYREAWCLMGCSKEFLAAEASQPNTPPQACRCPELSLRCAVCPRRT